MFKAGLKKKLEDLKKLNKDIQKLGGIGPSNVGSPEWKKQIQVQQKIKEFSKVNYLVNKLIIKKNDAKIQDKL